MVVVDWSNLQGEWVMFVQFSLILVKLNMLEFVDQMMNQAFQLDLSGKKSHSYFSSKKKRVANYFF
jgi:hypothetical protein